MASFRVLRIFLISFSGGVVAGSFFSWSFPVSLLLVSVAIGVGVVWFHSGRSLTLVLLGGTIVFLFSWWHTGRTISAWQSLPETDARLLRAEVVRDMSRNEQTKRVSLRPIECAGTCPATLVSVTFPVFADVREGMILKLDCPLRRPEKFDPTFDFPMFLAKDGIGYECRFPKEWKEDGFSDSRFRKIVLFFRSTFERGVARSIPEPEAGLVAGLLVGGDDRLPLAIQEHFSRTGLSHIIAVSGYNVSIVVAMCMSALVFFGLFRQTAVWVALLGMLFFTVLVGTPSSAVRASIMAGAALLATRAGRVGDPVNAILLAGSGMLLENPLLFRYDIGFQLSFLATIGIFSLAPALLLSLRAGDIFATTLAAEAFTLPVILFHFQTLPILSLLANALVLPLVPIAMLLGTIAALSGVLFPVGAALFGFPAFLVSKAILEIVGFFSGFSFAAISIPSFGIFGLLASLAGSFALATFLRKKVLLKRIV